MKVSTHVKINIALTLAAIVLASISILDVYTAFVYHRPILHPVINLFWAFIIITIGVWLHRKMTKK